MDAVNSYFARLRAERHAAQARRKAFEEFRTLLRKLESVPTQDRDRKSVLKLATLGGIVERGNCWPSKMHRDRYWPRAKTLIMNFRPSKEEKQQAQQEAQQEEQQAQQEKELEARREAVRLAFYLPHYCHPCPNCGAYKCPCRN